MASCLVRRRCATAQRQQCSWKAWDRSLAYNLCASAGTALASCSSDRVVRIWQESRIAGKGWRCTVMLEDTHVKSIRCCCWSPGGTHLASASFDGTTSIWSGQQGVWEEVSAAFAYVTLLQTTVYQAHESSAPSNLTTNQCAGRLAVPKRKPWLTMPSAYR